MDSAATTMLKIWHGSILSDNYVRHADKTMGYACRLATHLNEGGEPPVWGEAKRLFRSYCAGNGIVVNPQVWKA